MTTATEDLKLNGITIGEGVTELLAAYRAQQEKSDKVPEDPIIARQRRIAKNTTSLEDTVKGILGDSLKASKEHADKIIKGLAYKIAQVDGYTGKIDDFSDELVMKYLSNAASATGNPTIGNKTEFIKSIINLAAARPGDPLYDSNSALALLISHAATQQDKESRRVNYLQTLISEKWQQPKYGIALQKGLGDKFGIPFDETATASEALGQIARVTSAESQLRTLRSSKTYLNDPAKVSEHYAGQAKAAASGLHRRS